MLNIVTKKRAIFLAVLLVVVVAVVLICVFALNPAGDFVPYASTDFTLLNSDQEPVSLSDFIGRPVVVVFWASWCPDCKEQLPDFYEVYQEYKDSGIEFLMVNSTSGVRETEEQARRYLAEQGYDLDLVLWDHEGEAASAYELFFIPTTLMVDRDGMIVARYNDVISQRTLRRGIKDLLDG